MPFTFECGVCHSTYRLDEQQITADGVKVTCPKCLNFFFLRTGTAATETPVIERLVRDGAYEIQMPPPKSTELTAEEFLSDLGDKVAPKKKPKPVQKPIKYVSQGWLAEADTQIMAAELSDFPVDAPHRSKVDQLLIPFSLLIMLISLLLFLNYQRLIAIPGLEGLQAPVVTEPPAPAFTPVPRETPKPKYGFPVIEPSITATPPPAKTATPSNSPAS